MEDLFPKHAAALYLSHNEHLSSYETLEQCLENGSYERDQWVSEEQYEKSLATGSVWQLQWYPKTPVGFHILLAADLEELLKAAKEVSA